MRRTSWAACALLLTLAAFAPAAARAEMPLGEHMSGSLGFHHEEAPVGVRWWLPGQKVGIDAGIGFSSQPSSLFPDEKLQAWALDLGVPFVFHSWERVHLIARPGLLWRSREVELTAPPLAFQRGTLNQFDLSGEIETEIFLVSNVSVSASEGLALTIVNPPGPGDNQTSLNTLGNNFTRIGFHVYFFGGNR